MIDYRYVNDFVLWLRITDEHTVVANSPATFGSQRGEITREQPPSPRDPHKEFSQPITCGHLIYTK